MAHGRHGGSNVHREQYHVENVALGAIYASELLRCEEALVAQLAHHFHAGVVQEDTHCAWREGAVVGRANRQLLATGVLVPVDAVCRAQ